MILEITDGDGEIRFHSISSPATIKFILREGIENITVTSVDKSGWIEGSVEIKEGENLMVDLGDEI